MQQNISPTQAAELINDLRELVETTTVESHAADETHATATAAGDSKRDGAIEEADAVHEGELAAETKLHTDTMAEVKQQATERLDHARSQYEERLSEIEHEAEKTRKAAHRNLKEQEWLAESVYEAAGQEPGKRLQLTREELDRNAQRLDALEDDIQLFRNRCRMQAATAPESPEYAELDSDPETALEALREQVEECLDASHTLHRLFLPRIFIGPVAIIMLCIVAIIGWGACAGVLTLAQGGSFEQHLLPGLWGGLGLLVLSLALVWPLRRLASRQFHTQDMVLVTRIAVARAMRDAIQHTGEEHCRMQEEQHRTQRDEDIKSARENITPTSSRWSRARNVDTKNLKRTMPSSSPRSSSDVMKSPRRNRTAMLDPWTTSPSDTQRHEPTLTGHGTRRSAERGPNMQPPLNG